MRNYLYKIFIITTVSFISSVAYTKSDIQQGDILAFDPSIACDVLAVKLEKMKKALDEKKIATEFWVVLLRSAAPSAYKYGDLNLNYQHALDQYESMKKEYDRLVSQREDYCIPKPDKHTD